MVARASPMQGLCMGCLTPPNSCRESRTYYRAHLRNHLRSHADESDALRIAQLQERGRADAAWVVKKVGGCRITLRE